VIAVDTNLLIYSHRVEFPHHGRALKIVRGLAMSPVAWRIPWPCLGEFVSIVTNSRMFERPSTVEEATSVICWSKSQVKRAGVHDARIAAICLDHGVSELWTADRDFSKFPKLRTRNPLTEQPQ
jgi:predicted nucleic acid-binding protein